MTTTTLTSTEEEVKILQDLIIDSCNDINCDENIAYMIAQFGYGTNIECEETECENIINIMMDTICKTCQCYFCDDCITYTVCNQGRHCTKCNPESIIQCYDCTNRKDEFKATLCLKCEEKDDGCELCFVCKCYRCSYCNTNGFFHSDKVFYECNHEICIIVVCNGCYYKAGLSSCEICTDDHYCPDHHCISCEEAS